MLNIVDCGRQRSFGNINNSVVHLRGNKPVVIPNDADHGNVDVREDIRWGPKNRKHAHHQDEYGHDHEGVRPSQCKSNNPHIYSYLGFAPTTFDRWSNSRSCAAGFFAALAETMSASWIAEPLPNNA